MNLIRYRLLLFCALLLTAASGAVAQTYPLPASTPNTDVPLTCTDCGNLKTIGYPPVLNFVGRWADASSAKDYQQNFRTARPRMARVFTGKNRLYTILGSALAAYDIDKFIARLSTRPQEALQPATLVPVAGGNPRFAQFGPSEIFLWWDAFFYAENGGGWQTAIEDGLIRLWDLDWDDRGNVYLAYSVFGWGIIKDDGEQGGGWFHSVSQSVRQNGLTPDHIMSMKTSDGHYYAAVSDKNMSMMQIWDTTNASAPVKLPDFPGRSFYLWAKDATGSHIGVVEYSGGLSIFTPDNFVRTGQPVVQFQAGGGGTFKTITTDGTNFYAYGAGSDGPFIDVISPSGSTYVESRFYTHVGYSIPEGMHYGDGYLATYGSESNASGTSNIRLYKVTPTPGSASPVALTEISFDMPVPGSPSRQLPFWSMYYGANQPPDYVKPFYNQFADVTPLKRGGKLYLILSAYGLGDVWEVKAGDTISARLKASVETPNPNSTGTGGPFYGDRQTFGSVLSSGQSPVVNWDFGDGVVTPSTAGSDVKHQFGGITDINSLPAVRKATVVNASDPGMSDSVSVTLAAPSVRFALPRASLLFRQPDASSAAPIVTGDAFTDASDGSIEGHYTDWVLDGTSNKKLPSDTFGVGTCGVHTLNFNAHYGPYSGSGSTMASTNGDLLRQISPFTYTVRPFAISVQEPPPSTVNDPNAVFTASVRSGDATALPGGGSTAVTYKWELVNGTTVLTSSSGSATLATIPSFSVVKTTFSTTGLRVQLTTTVANSAVAAGCSGFATNVAQSGLLNGPDPVIAKTGCATVGLPCSYTVTSATNPTLAGWSFAWSTNAPNVTSSTGNNTAEFRPQFTTTTDYTVTVTVTNGIGSKTVVTPSQHIDKPACSSAPDNINMAIGIANNTGLHPNDVVSFLIFPRGWEPSAQCDKFEWTFGDGGTSTDMTPTHAYANAGTYTATLKLTGALSTGTYTTTVNVTSSGDPGTGNPGGFPPPGGGGNNNSCPAPTATSAYITYYGNTSNCTASGGTCNPGETLQLEIHPDNGFNISCGTTTATWQFGDGTIGTGLTPTHVYSVAGTYNAQVTVQNSGGAFVYAQQVKIGNVQPKACGTLSVTNLAVAYSGTGCTDVSNNCKSNDSLSFHAASATYDFSCNATHTYDWNFGDGSAHSSAATPTHTYSGPGSYTVTLTVSNGSSSATVTKPITIASGTGGATGSCPAMIPDGNVYIVYFGDGCSITGGNCNAKTNVDFQVGAFGYPIDCGTPSYSWDFGDGSAKATAANPSHKYAANGTYNVKVTLSNGSQTVDLTAKVTVTGAGNPAVPPKHRAGGH